MKQYRICSKCVMDTSAEEITFNEQGVCNFCRQWEAVEKQRQGEMLHPGLAWILYKIKKVSDFDDNKPYFRDFSNKMNYDCVLGLSGGVDSSMCLHRLIENGIRPLCFSVDNGFNNPKADENIMRMVEALKVPFYKMKVNIDEFCALQFSFAYAGLANAEIPSDHIIRASAYKLAIENDIKFIISGGNHSTEGIMPASWGYDPSDLYHIKAVFKKIMGRKIKYLPTISLLQYIYYRFIKKIKIINLLDFYDYNREEAIKILEEKYGYKSYGDKHCESELTKWFQNFYLPQKFGFDKRRPHYSSMINSGQMTREEAIIKLAEPLEFPRFGIEEKVLSFSNHSYKDYPNSEKLRKFISGFYRKIKWLF